MILHIVLYQPKASATPAELAELADALQAASREIPSVRQVRVGRAKDLGYGYQTWPKDQNNGCVAIFEFEDKPGLSAYLTHPAHRRLADLFWKTSERPTILDVEAIDSRVDEVAKLIGHLAK